MINLHPSPVRGITLLIAIIVSTVVLSVALSLLDVAYKQQLLASTAKQSQYAFYNADSAMECALYADQKDVVFDYNYAGVPSVTCANLAVANYNDTKSGNIRTITFDVKCPGGAATDYSGHVEVYKATGSATCSAGKKTCIYTTGYSSCKATDPRRIERGLKVLY